MLCWHCTIATFTQIVIDVKFGKRNLQHFYAKCLINVVNVINDEDEKDDDDDGDGDDDGDEDDNRCQSIYTSNALSFLEIDYLNKINLQPSFQLYNFLYKKSPVCNQISTCFLMFCFDQPL